jgi:peptide deformylase
MFYNKHMTWKPQKPPFRAFKQSVFSKAAQVSEFIYQIGEYDALRLPSREVPLSDIQSPDFKAKIQYLKDSILKYRELTGYGRGITAVQIGIPERFSVVYTPEELLIIINPKITNKSEKLLKYPEICMSTNPIIAPTVRPAWIEFEYYDEDGNKQEWTTKDDSDQGKILNRVFQHEIDHMDGVINVDIVKHPKELLLESDPTFYENASFEEIL